MAAPATLAPDLSKIEPRSEVVPVCDATFVVKRAKQIESRMKIRLHAEVRITRPLVALNGFSTGANGGFREEKLRGQSSTVDPQAICSLKLQIILQIFDDILTIWLAKSRTTD